MNTPGGVRRKRDARGGGWRRAGRSAYAGLAALTLSGTASAANFELQSDTVFQAYSVASPFGAPIIDRRRLLQTLTLGVYHLQGEARPNKPDYQFVMRLRLDADFGVNSHLGGAEAGGETSFDVAGGRRYVPGLQIAPVDLMYGYLEGRNLAGGWLGFKLGRQYVVDPLGWWSFDGGLVRVTTPFYVQAEVYGGLEQRGGLPLSLSRFERQGVWRGSRDGFGGQRRDAVDNPSFQPASFAPAFGASLESAGVSFLHGKLAYRRVYNTGSTVTQQFPVDVAGDTLGGYRTLEGLRLSSERIGYSVWADKHDLGGVKGGFQYDLHLGTVASAYAGLEAYPTSWLTLGADFDHFVPTFDADSIWNWFTKSPVTTGTARFDLAAHKRLDVSGSGGVRMWEAEGEGSNATPLTTLDALGNLQARYRLKGGEMSLRGTVQAGERGHRGGADLSGEARVAGDRVTLGGILSLYDWNDATRPDRNALSFGYVVQAAVRPLPKDVIGRPDLRFEWQHDMNRLVGHRFRVMGLVSIWTGK